MSFCTTVLIQNKKCPTYLRHQRIRESNRSGRAQHHNKLVRVLLELVVHRRRIQNRSHQTALGRYIARIDNNRQHLFAANVPCLNHLRAAKQHMTAVLFLIENYVTLAGHRCFRHRHTFAGQHRFVQNAIARQQRCIAVHRAAGRWYLQNIAGHQIFGLDNGAGAVRTDNDRIVRTGDRCVEGQLILF